MTAEELRLRGIESELVFSSSRSSGPGGQNVNKTNTKIELRFNIYTSSYLSGDEKVLIASSLKNRINNSGELVLSSQSERTQLMNKRVVMQRFFDLLSSALTPQTQRIATKPKHSSRLQRVNEKRIKGLIKKQRQAKNFDQDN